MLGWLLCINNTLKLNISIYFEISFLFLLPLLLLSGWWGFTGVHCVEVGWNPRQVTSLSQRNSVRRLLIMKCRNILFAFPVSATGYLRILQPSSLILESVSNSTQWLPCFFCADQVSRVHAQARTPVIWLLLNMRSSDFIVFGRQGQTTIQACFST